nr:hypothetical protein DVH24_018094 [Ipomoea batatas]
MGNTYGDEDTSPIPALPCLVPPHLGLTEESRTGTENKDGDRDGVSSFGTSKGAATAEINADEGDKSDPQNDIHSSPFLVQICQQTGFAGIAGIAELRLVVAPLQTIHVGGHVYRTDPICWVHKCVLAFCGRLTASRLPRQSSVAGK